MTEEKTGIVKIVASNGGLKFEDEPEKWYNATATAKPYVKPEFKGKTVTIRLTDKGDAFSFISLAKNQPQQTQEPVKQPASGPDPVMTKDDYWRRKELRDIDT